MTDARTPQQEYQTRLDARRAQLAALAGRDRLIAIARPIVFVIAGLLLWGAYGRGEVPVWLAWLPVPLFFALVVAHARVVARRSRIERAATHYARGLDRLGDKWAGGGVGGERYAVGDHPYAADLDLFGKGSLFELLCTCRTQLGEEALAGWLLAPAAADEVRARQAAVDELRHRIDLREDLALLGDAVRAELDGKALGEWAVAPRRMTSPLLPLGLIVLALVTVGLTVAWMTQLTGWIPPLCAVAIELGVLRALEEQVKAVSAAVNRPGRHLEVLAQVLARLQREKFASDKLRALAAELTGDSHSAAAAIASLSRRVDLLSWQRNQVFIPFAILLLWGPLWAYALEAWRALYGPKIARWLAAVGELEALCALSGYAYEHPADPFPEIGDATDGPRFSGVGLGHPLLPVSRCVRNDVTLGGELRLYLVSGSNMSGKSTLLRTVGTNVVLALAGAPVRAQSLRLTPLQVGATLRVVDSLQEGASRFYAEITRLQKLVELTGGALPLLFLLDEILHGTNSHDRKQGAEAVVRGLLDRGACGLCTTHDLAIAALADALGPRARNVHFEDQIVDGRLSFDYAMRDGVVTRSNALALMRAVGLDV